VEYVHSKRRIIKKEKKEKEQGLKSKRGKTSFEKLYVCKKRKEKREKCG
jgi:hypothetical protein